MTSVLNGTNSTSTTSCKFGYPSITSHQANALVKHLLTHPLKEGEKWYAISKKWFNHFSHFAYLNEEPAKTGEEENDNNDTQSNNHPAILVNREYPSPMNNLDIANEKNYLLLKREMIENKHFVWVCMELYNYLFEWFGVEEGSPIFEREVIAIGILSECVIEIHPYFIRVVICDQNGNPDWSSTVTVNVSRQDSLTTLMENVVKLCPITALDSKHRLWRKKRENSNERVIQSENEPAIEVEGDTNIKSLNADWHPFSNDPLPPPADDDNSDDNIHSDHTYDEITLDDNNINDNDNDNDDDDEHPEIIEEIINADHSNSESKEVIYADDEWALVTTTEAVVALEKWAFNFDFLAEIHLMLELADEWGDWSRTIHPDAWRSQLGIGDPLDIYDPTQLKWYTGKVVNVRDDPSQIKITYDGYSFTYDEWLPRDTDRVSVLNTHTEPQPDTMWSGIVYNESPRVSMDGGAYRSLWGMSSFYSPQHESGSPAVRGCVGLRNLGNTCFMNSTIQCLAHCPILVEYFLNDVFRKDINRDNPLGWQGKVVDTWSDLLKKYWSNEYCVLAPSHIKSTLGEIQPRFSGYEQHDSSELLQFLLDGLHEDMNRIKKKPYTQKIEGDDRSDLDVSQDSWYAHKLRNDSIIVDTFQGQLKSRVQCPDCKRISVTFDPFMFLSVPLPCSQKKVWKFVTVVSLEIGVKPKLYGIEIAKLASISDFKDKISKIAGVKSDRLVICEVWHHRIYNFYANYSSVDEMSDTDKTIAYEVPTNEDMLEFFPKAKKFKLISINHKIIEKSMLWGSVSLDIKEIGIPLLIRLPIDYNINCIWLHEFVIRIMKPHLIAQNITDWNPKAQLEAESQEPTSLSSDEEDNNNPNDRRRTSYSPHFNDGNQEQGNMHGIQTMFVESEEDNSQKDDDDDDNDGCEGEVDEVVSEHNSDIENEVIAEPAITDNTTTTTTTTTNNNNDNTNINANTPSNISPFTIYVMDKYGRNCGIHSMMEYCLGCKLQQLDTICMQDNMYNVISLSVRWSLNALNCFDHISFNELQMDESIPEEMRNNLQNNNYQYSARYSFNNSYFENSKPLKLSECLDEFAKEETLSENNAWYCKECKDHKCAKKKLDLWKLPDVCVVHLKRFTQNGIYREKNDVKVLYPIKGLDLRPWILNEQETSVYDLFAVSIHMGGMGGGHYVAHVKNLDNGKWYDFNDSSVSEIDEEMALTSAAYVLFYKKQKIEDQDQNITQKSININSNDDDNMNNNNVSEHEQILLTKED